MLALKDLNNPYALDKIVVELSRKKETVELQGIEGEPVILFQTERGKKPGSYTVHRNGVLVVRR